MWKEAAELSEEMKQPRWQKAASKGKGSTSSPFPASFSHVPPDLEDFPVPLTRGQRRRLLHHLSWPLSPRWNKKWKVKKVSYSKAAVTAECRLTQAGRLLQTLPARVGDQAKTDEEQHSRQMCNISNTSQPSQLHCHLLPASVLLCISWAPFLQF